MKVRINKKQMESLKARHPNCREWQAYEMPDRQQTNNLKRAGFEHITTEDGLEYWAKRS